MDTLAFTQPFGIFVKNTADEVTFVPNKLPPAITYDESLISLIAEASLELGNLSGIGLIIPNPHLLIRPYLTQEAVLSSKIEGTQASILDIFRFEAGERILKEERETKGIDEVVNYVIALNKCLENVKEDKKVDIEMIKDAHRILMENIVGHPMLKPGEFRKVQNWIGKPGTRIEDATYVPPPPEKINELLVDLEKFIQNPPGRIPTLVQLAMIHYVFEAIHPFIDGNGRIGRLIIPVLLAERKLLEQPLLYLSAYIERNKTEYYALLLSVSQKGDWINWIRFFLRGIIVQSRDATNNIQRLLSLKTKYEQKLTEIRAPYSMIKTVEYLFSNPIITVSGIAKHVGITYPPAKRTIEKLLEIEILKERDDEKERGKSYFAHEILSVLTSHR